MTMSSVRALNDDILAYIFHISAINLDPDNWLDYYDIEVDGVLNAIRISQVSSRWRGLIMNLPTLWGRLVDLSPNRSTSSFNRETEIIRRSANAPLSIRAELSTVGDEGSTRQFSERFLQVLTVEWERIQHFSIDLQDYPNLDEDYYLISGLSDVLKRPAPALVTFSLRISDDDVEYSPSLGLGPQAPLLRAVRYGRISIGDNNFWLPNIKKLSLDSTQTVMSEDCVRLFTLEVLFNVLHITRSLQHLELFMALPDDTDEIQELTPSPHSIPLHHLRSLHLNEELFPCVCILKSICFGNSLHQLDIYTHSSVEDEEATDQIIGLMKDFIVLTMPLFHQYFTSTKVNELNFSFYDSLLVVNAGTCRIELSCAMAGMLVESAKQAGFLDSLANLDLRWIERLGFNLDTSFLQQIPQDQAAIRRLFNSVHSLTTLSTSLTCLEGILSMKEDLQDAFPSLRILNPVWSQHARPDPPDIIYQFLSWRIERGRRIETLDIDRVSVWIRQHGSLVRLLEDKFFGLQVRWLEGLDGEDQVSVSYIVGDGDSDRHSVFTVFAS